MQGLQRLEVDAPSLLSLVSPEYRVLALSVANFRR